MAPMSYIDPVELERWCRIPVDELASPDRRWQHNINNGDGNGHSHVRAAMLGPSLTIPFVDGRLTLGRWQEVVFVDLDERPRDRRLIVQAMGL